MGFWGADTVPAEAFLAPLSCNQASTTGSYLGLSTRLEVGAAAEAIAEARGGEVALGEAATGDWAEAGSGVAAWLVHTGACSIGVLMRQDQERQQVKRSLSKV